MYVCNCNGIRSREVDAAIEAGASTPRRVLAHLGQTPQCGRCLTDIRDRLRQRRCGGNSVMAE